MAEIIIKKAEETDWPYIQEKMGKYLLDADNARWQDFFVVKNSGKTVAFARIIDHGEYVELASIGVDYYHRTEGHGVRLLSFLTKEATRLHPGKDIYGVTHRPGFVRKGGFEAVETAPEALEYKKNHKCKDPSRITIMKYKGSIDSGSQDSRSHTVE